MKIELTSEDLNRIEMALRCRIEACEENDEFLDERRWAKRFKSTHDKIVAMMDRFKRAEGK